jgi:hypothetical protein
LSRKIPAPPLEEQPSREQRSLEQKSQERKRQEYKERGQTPCEQRQRGEELGELASHEQERQGRHRHHQHRCEEEFHNHQSHKEEPDKDEPRATVQVRRIPQRPEQWQINPAVGIRTAATATPHAYEMM